MHIDHHKLHQKKEFHVFELKRTVFDLYIPQPPPPAASSSCVACIVIRSSVSVIMRFVLYTGFKGNFCGRVYGTPPPQPEYSLWKSICIELSSCKTCCYLNRMLLFTLAGLRIVYHKGFCREFHPIMKFIFCTGTFVSFSLLPFLRLVWSLFRSFLFLCTFTSLSSLFYKLLRVGISMVGTSFDRSLTHKQLFHRHPEKFHLSRQPRNH